MMGPFEAGAILFIAIAVIVSLAFYFRYLVNVAYQQTVRAAIEKGQQLTPEFLDRLGESLAGKRRHRDLRFGVISLALGLGIAIFGLIAVHDATAERSLIAIGVIPILIGVALIGLWKFVPPE